jgi:putative cardiolipin synthase
MIQHLSLVTVATFALFISTAHADHVRYLAKPDEALAAFAGAAANARSSIDIATFIFEPCHTSTQVLFGLLEQRARAGVRVRLLLDSLQQKSPREQALADYAAKHGMQVRFYNSREPNMRMHIKMFIADGQTYIAGGRNISDEYFGMSRENNYVDRDLMVTGASVRQAQASFEELWTSRDTARRTGKAEAFASWTKFCQADISADVEKAADFLYNRGPAIVNAIPERNCSSVNFYADHYDFGDSTYGNGDSEYHGVDDEYMTAMRLNRKLSTKAVLAFINGARSTLHMENWVYIPVFFLRDAFASLRTKKIEVRVLTNEDIEDGPAFFREAMDYAISYFSAKHSVGTQKVSLISSKGTIGQHQSFELTPPMRIPTHLHGKIFVRDRQDLMVGSFNLDSRSYNTNLESVIQVNGCPELAADAQPYLEGIQKTDSEDRAAGLIPKKKEPSFFAKFFARATLIFL